MKNKELNSRLGKVGGQAVLEGVMMKSGDQVSLAVRREDGSIKVKNSTFVSARKKNRFLNLPLIRGCVNMVEMMRLSFSTLNDSAEMLGIDQEEAETRFEKWLRRKFGNKLMNVVMGIGMVLGVILSVGLFLVLPNVVTMGINRLVTSGGGSLPSFVQNLIAGIMRILIFIAYLLLVSLMKDIRRTFEYHGAEHKSVACYEAGLPLTPENAATCTRFHPRCGTSFIFVMLIISILITAFINWNTWPKIAIILTKLAMVPVIVGVGFEFLMWAGKYPNPLTRALSAPGLWMQRITTREPDAGQLEVAITALKNAMPDQFPEARAEMEETNAAEAGEIGGDVRIENTETDGDGSNDNDDTEHGGNTAAKEIESDLQKDVLTSHENGDHSGSNGEHN